MSCFRLRTCSRLCVLAVALSLLSTGSLAQDAGSDAGVVLSSTRLLRRLSLTLRGQEPSLAEYQAAQAAEQRGAFPAHFDSQITAYLNSPQFYDEMLAFGHDYLTIGDYTRGSSEGGIGASFKGSQAVPLQQCPPSSPYAGKFYFAADRYVDGGALPKLPLADGGAVDATWCDVPNALEASVEPWWAPGTQVSVIGNAGNPALRVGTQDCGRVGMGNTTNAFYYGGCGCGPNLQYCYPNTLVNTARYPSNKESDPLYPDSFRRMLHEEPARLFAHIVTTDSSFADLVTGDYTVAPRWLRFLYVRWGRMNTANGGPTDSSGWFRTANERWEKIQLQTLHPNLLAARTYTFDPRTDLTAPAGIPAAGVLTMLGPNSWYPRERVRAARYLETFACKVFSAPDPTMVFSPPFRNDPKREGPCQHCHLTIEPAAIHFKRLEIEDSSPMYGTGHANLGGVGFWRWKDTQGVSYFDMRRGRTIWKQPYGRWNDQFIPGTYLTPITDAGVIANPDARFIDFLPAGETLFGKPSDGTIGPLGFGKILVSSGEFDQCAVQRIYERVIGQSLIDDPNRHSALVQQFVAGGRKVKPFIRSLVTDSEFRRGR